MRLPEEKIGAEAVDEAVAVLESENEAVASHLSLSDDAYLPAAAWQVGSPTSSSGFQPQDEQDHCASRACCQEKQDSCGCRRVPYRSLWDPWRRSVDRTDLSSSAAHDAWAVVVGAEEASRGKQDGQKEHQAQAYFPSASSGELLAVRVLEGYIREETGGVDRMMTEGRRAECTRRHVEVVDRLSPIHGGQQGEDRVGPILALDPDDWDRDDDKSEGNHVEQG